MKVEKMLNLSADSERLGGIGDMLSIQVNEVRKKYESGKMIPLSDEELELVAGGRPTRRSVCPRCGRKPSSSASNALSVLPATMFSRLRSTAYCYFGELTEQEDREPKMNISTS